MAAGSENVQEGIADDALGKHVSRFVGPAGFFSSATVTAGLTKIHGHQPGLKGPIIATFNGIHAGAWRCPYAQSAEKKDYSLNLHLGTTRIWNADGSINEERWQQLIAIAERKDPADEEYITLSALKAYLEHCYANDPDEQSTGRNANSFFSSRYAQATAATQAWNEVFDRLACGWVLEKGGKELEPYIDLSLVRLFFEDSEAAFLKSEEGELPKPKMI